jgi:hypothetical protein
VLSKIIGHKTDEVNLQRPLNTVRAVKSTGLQCDWERRKCTQNIGEETSWTATILKAEKNMGHDVE